MNKVKLSIVAQVFNQLCANPCTYNMGSKASPLTIDSSQVDQLDCSGWVQYGINKGTEGANDPGEGSSEIADYLNAQAADPASGVRRVDYASMGDSDVGADPSRLFVGHFPPGTEGPGAAGHIWFLRSNGTKMVTMECHGASGGQDGVSSRDWDHAVLVDNATDCWELPTC